MARAFFVVSRARAWEAGVRNNSALLNRKQLRPLAVALALQFAALNKTRAENHADYRYNRYIEEGGRIEIETHSALFEQSLPWQLTLKAEYVNDAVSGASPTGAPPVAPGKNVPLAHMEDMRNAGYLETDIRLGRHTLSPQASYSLEDDYESIGLSITDAIELNQKNTIVSLGYSHNFDSIFPQFWGGRREHKNSDDFLIGVNQLLTPKAYVSANFTFGQSHGYLNDPYKGVHFDNYPDPIGTSVFPEKRPTNKTKEVGYISGTYFFERVNGSAEAGYRIYHDSFGILSHTVTLGWHQKIGKYVLLSPLFRYSQQTAADFYAPRFPGDPQDPTSPIPIPEHYSADYRLSKLRTFTYGLSATFPIKEHLWFDLSYQHYEMYGLDGVTSSSAYPKANVYSAGLRILW
jgi:hypothetical protein